MERNWASINFFKCDYCNILWRIFLFLISEHNKLSMPPSLHISTQSTQITSVDTWDVISDLIGWVCTFLIWQILKLCIPPNRLQQQSYFFVWSVSFYPQIFLNWKRKKYGKIKCFMRIFPNSVHIQRTRPFNRLFMLQRFRLLMLFSKVQHYHKKTYRDIKKCWLFFFRSIIYLSTLIKKFGMNVSKDRLDLYDITPTYVTADHQRHPDSNRNLVRMNDVVFSLHAFIMSLFILLQTCVYKVWREKFPDYSDSNILSRRNTNPNICHHLQHLLYG